jgi:peptidoglycan/xylan/chitin deacetylase (PgdA/CDA1 family)
MPRLTFRRLLMLAVVAAPLLAAAMAITVVLEWFTLVEAIFAGFALTVVAALGVLALGLRRLDQRVRRVLGERGSIEERTKTLTKRYQKSLQQMTDALEELRGVIGEQRLELVSIVRQLEAERAAAAATTVPATTVPAATASAATATTISTGTTGRAIAVPRQSPIPPPSAVTETPVTPPRRAKGIVGPGGSILYTSDGSVALTFDDGPDPEYTPQLLALLRRHSVTATFFLIGAHAHLHKDVVARIADEGHVIANHTWTHRMDLSKLPEQEIRAELQNTTETILAAAPDTTVGYFRAPGGYFDERLVDIAHSLGMRSIFWDVDPRDWAFEDYGHGLTMVNRIVTHLQENVRPGSIVLSHDFQKPDTIAAYRILLPWLKDNFNLAPLTPDTIA